MATSGKRAKKTTKKTVDKVIAVAPVLSENNPDHKKQLATTLLKHLYKHYPDAHCELNYTKPHELLVATILSAQATDVAVNKATPALFKKYPEPADYAAATPEEIEPYVKSLGFYHNKAKAIQAAMTTVANEHGGEVPDNMDDLLKLRGVARKTANVVLGNAYQKNEGVVVDTHVSRLSQRFGLTENTDPVKIEQDLMSLFPRKHWTMLSHMLIFHGRRVCKARNTRCAEHPICIKFCSNAQKFQ